jgi:hypothetical protein
MELDLVFELGPRSLILKNSAKTRIASFEIQRIKLKPKPEESLT